MTITVITAPADEPLTVAEAKAHLRVDSAADDALIQRLIGAARRKVEAEVGRALITQTLELTLDTWPGGGAPVVIPQPPVSSVTSVKYVDPAGVLQTWSSAQYQVNLARAPAHLRPAYGYCWPTIRCQMAAIQVRYVAGYGAASADVPEDIRAAMLMIIGHLYEHREDVADFQVYSVPKAADWLLANYRVGWF